ncbi:MAG: UbiX family flavin prenyltransferase [Acidobacteriota bacterium]
MSSLRLALLVSGASGMVLPRRVLAALADHPEVERLHLVVSRGASQVLRHELGPTRTGAEALIEAAAPTEIGRAKIAVHRDNDLDAPIASGSYPFDGAVVLPCSAGTLGALAVGTASTLVHRTAAVAMKEGLPLVLGFRETPFSLLHVENMRRLILAGATLLPPLPAFYVGEDMARFVDHYALRVLDRFGLRETEATGLRWGEP